MYAIKRATLRRSAGIADLTSMVLNIGGDLAPDQDNADIVGKNAIVLDHLLLKVEATEGATKITTGTEAREKETIAGQLSANLGTTLVGIDLNIPLNMIAINGLLLRLC